MNQKDLLKICEDNGFKFSLTLLYRYGKRYGFLVKYKNDGRERYKLDTDRFMEWIDQHKIDESLISIKDACKQNDISYGALKYILIKNNCNIIKLGQEQNGLFYAKRTDIARVIGQYNRRS